MDSCEEGYRKPLKIIIIRHPAEFNSLDAPNDTGIKWLVSPSLSSPPIEVIEWNCKGFLGYKRSHA